MTQKRSMKKEKYFPLFLSTYTYVFILIILQNKTIRAGVKENIWLKKEIGEYELPNLLSKLS
jgi:hypothetical protein